jgi:hypothetical protein
MFQMITASFLAVAEIAEVLIPVSEMGGILTNVSQVVDIQLQSEVVRCYIKLMD